MPYTGLLYHERQVAGLCALHCLNSLLQGRQFDAPTLAQLAQAVDARERAVMAEAGTGTAEYRAFVAEGSHNYSAEGNYSLQVVEDALEIFGLRLVNFVHPDAADARASPLTQDAFVCNLAEHWVTIRRVEDTWFNFNSIFEAPELMSAFYVSAYLDTLLSEGWAIFVVRGALPPVQPVPGALNWKHAKARTEQPRPSTSYDAQLAMVLEMSRREAEQEEARRRQRTASSEAANSNANASTLAPAASPGTPGSSHDLLDALKLSVDMPTEPALLTDACTVAFRMPDGSRTTRRFAPDDAPAALFHYLLHAHDIDPNAIEIGVPDAPVDQLRFGVASPVATLAELFGARDTMVAVRVQPRHG